MRYLFRNIKKDLRCHFKREGARPFLMTISCLVFAVLAALTAYLLYADILAPDSWDAVPPDYAVTLYCFMSLAGLSILAPLAFDIRIRREIAFTGHLRRAGGRHRAGTILASKYIVSFFYAATAYLLGLIAACIASKGIFGGAFNGVNYAAYGINGLIFLFVLSVITVSVFCLDAPNALKLALPAVITAASAAALILLGADLTGILSTADFSAPSVIGSFPLLLCLALSPVLMLVSYFNIKIQRLEKSI